MKTTSRLIQVMLFSTCFLATITAFGANMATQGDLLSRVQGQVSDYLDQFSDVKCTEKVDQQKLTPNGKVELERASTYDYLVILTNAGGEVSLDESRLAVGSAAKPDKKNRPLLVTNGFATLFLIFHTYYAQSFQFALGDVEMLNGHAYQKISFQHIRGTRSPAALSLRGREYPLELSGTAWVDPQTATITKIEMTVGNTMEDVGLKALRSEVAYAPVPFRDSQATYWFPSQATVEVETQRQHWRNTHTFSDYKKFAVSTEEKVKDQ
ncbi:MAG: hypothetical protein ACRD3Q_10505 [Terriglobales bacterium]